MARRYQGLRRLRENLGDDAIGYEPLGGWELIADDATMARCRDFLPTLNAWAAEFTGQSEAYADGTAHLAEFGFGGTRYLIHNRAEGLVHTGHMMDALMRQSVASGVSLCHGAWVERMDEDGDGVELHTQPFGPVRSRRAVVCTNGFARQLLPALDVTPARAQVLVTDPIPGLRFRGAFHFDEGYYYFRNVGDQVLFGGARNLDFEGETTTEMVTTGLIQDRLERCLREIIIPGVNFRVQRRWSGIMGLGPTKSPIVQAVSGTTVAAVRMGGMGVALGTLAGEEAAALTLGTL
jgi:glycine/D-amino acid oxidase-like deaminating enzyme